MEKSNKKEEINLLDILRFLQQKRKNILLSIIASVFVFAGAFFILVNPRAAAERGLLLWALSGGAGAVDAVLERRDGGPSDGAEPGSGGRAAPAGVGPQGAF